MKRNPLADLPETPPPDHLDRVPGAIKRHRLANAHCFWHLAERLYALVKNQVPYLHFLEAQRLRPLKCSLSYSIGSKSKRLLPASSGLRALPPRRASLSSLLQAI